MEAGLIQLNTFLKLDISLSSELFNDTVVNGVVVQAVRGFSVHFWKKLTFFAQMISSMYSFDPDIAQAILTLLAPN